MEITQESKVEDILREHPECIEVFDRHGMPCRTCMMISYSTVGEGAIMHDVDLETLLRELRGCCKG